MGVENPSAFGKVKFPSTAKTPWGENEVFNLTKARSNVRKPFPLGPAITNKGRCRTEHSLDSPKLKGMALKLWVTPSSRNRSSLKHI